LQAYGARGTFYAAPGLMDAQNELGEQFHREDLDTVLGEGHELGSHTFRHLSCRFSSRGKFEADVLKGREAIHRMTGHDPVNFAYPYGHVTMALKKRIGAQMTTCRGTFAGVNGPMIDCNLLRANSLYGGQRESGTVDKLLAESEAGGWLIFYTHDVRDKPSPYGCTPTLFKEAVVRALKKGFTIAPVAAVIATVERRLSDQALDVGVTPMAAGDHANRLPVAAVRKSQCPD
jgi:peptidoglycan/xylan/chitin deacetylase (PgdA/CDA1 family)